MDVNHFLIDVHHFSQASCNRLSETPATFETGPNRDCLAMAKQEGALGDEIEVKLGLEGAKLRPSPQAMVLQDIFDAQYGAVDLEQSRLSGPN